MHTKLLQQQPKEGELLYSCNFFLWNSVLQGCFWFTESTTFFCVWPLFAGGCVSFILVPLKRTWGTWDRSRFLHIHTNVDDFNSGIARAVLNRKKSVWLRRNCREVP